MFYLGIDAGGTKTSFMLINHLGEVLSTYTSGTCHIHQVGFDGFRKVIQEGIDKICNEINICRDDLSYSFLGLPAYGENESEQLKMNSIITEILGENKFSCGNDVEVALAGSLACQPGICIILGTGAIASGITNDLKTARTSGWGYICGDEGSGYWIAKKGVEIFGKQSDHRLERTALYDIFKNELKLENDFDLIFLIKDEYKQDRTKVANLAMLVYKAALKGDKYALDIYRQAAKECLLMVNGLTNQLEFTGVLNISYSGSVFNSKEFILDPLRNYLQDNYTAFNLTAPILPPIKGAALNALKLHKGEIPEGVVHNLAKEPKEILV